MMNAIRRMAHEWLIGGGCLLGANQTAPVHLVFFWIFNRIFFFSASALYFVQSCENLLLTWWYQSGLDYTMAAGWCDRRTQAQHRIIAQLESLLQLQVCYLCQLTSHHFVIIKRPFKISSLLASFFRSIAEFFHVFFRFFLLHLGKYSPTLPFLSQLQPVVCDTVFGRRLISVRWLLLITTLTRPINSWRKNEGNFHSDSLFAKTVRPV